LSRRRRFERLFGFLCFLRVYDYNIVVILGSPWVVLNMSLDLDLSLLIGVIVGVGVGIVGRTIPNVPR
jgi:hypothetical protein